MKITKSKNKLIDCIAVMLTVTVFYLFDIPCIFQALLKIPCPGCGMTRSYISLIRFDLQKAFEFHPMFWSVPVLILLYFTDGKLFRSKWLNRLLLFTLFAGFFLNWLFRLLAL